MPMRKTEEEIKESQEELARLERILELKRKRKKVAKLIQKADRENKKYIKNKKK